MSEADQLPPPVDLDLAAHIVPHVHLAAARLFEVHASFVMGAQIPDPPYTFTTGIGFAWARREDGFGYVIRCEVTAFPLDELEQPFWKCEAAHELTYQAENADQFSDEEAIPFGMSSGVLAAWPYLRETVQSMSARSGLNPIVLDVIRFPGPGWQPTAEDDS
ncbi:MAG TPA: hypothetical protein VG435_09865 [Acidimicrobiales bacterium]|jgi:hypothetical protein|nr:hypothetical protein [Acidimicrobiales bacterium]